MKGWKFLGSRPAETLSGMKLIQAMSRPSLLLKKFVPSKLQAMLSSIIRSDFRVAKRCEVHSHDSHMTIRERLGQAPLIGLTRTSIHFM